MAIVGHRSTSIYRGIGSVDGTILKKNAAKVAAFHQSSAPAKNVPGSGESDTKKAPGKEQPQT